MPISGPLIVVCSRWQEVLLQTATVYRLLAHKHFERVVVANHSRVEGVESLNAEKSWFSWSCAAGAATVQTLLQLHLIKGHALLCS
ncbi:hypothetical protein PC116_g28001 [Phytophthora cactorum]|nr:hypothetical protein PC116_g28001 [Phytophthora cactorum]